MTEKKFNEIQPCKKELFELDLAMEKFGIKEIKITKPSQFRGVHDPVLVNCNFEFKDGTNISRMFQYEDFVGDPLDGLRIEE